MDVVGNVCGVDAYPDGFAANETTILVIAALDDCAPLERGDRPPCRKPLDRRTLGERVRRELIPILVDARHDPP